ncbi:hypothetical protein DFH27DRAFT_47000 [Peziza echinospora]|nr:hypothetical protein DFH27DRAFT_47000 [Peziza echinospora]
MAASARSFGLHMYSSSRRSVLHRRRPLITPGRCAASSIANSTPPPPLRPQLQQQQAQLQQVCMNWPRTAGPEIVRISRPPPPTTAYISPSKTFSFPSLLPRANSSPLNSSPRNRNRNCNPPLLLSNSPLNPRQSLYKPLPPSHNTYTRTMATAMMGTAGSYNDQYTPRDGDPVLPLFSLKGKNAIVTGAGGGIGLAVADCLAEAGANVIIWYNHNTAAHDRAAEIAARWGVKCLAYKVDVTDHETVEAAVRDQVEAELDGHLDVFVANAGIPWIKGPILDAGEEGLKHYREVMSTDMDSLYYSALAAGKYFKKQGSGSFIATASMSGHIVNIPQLQATYNAAKAGVLHFCRSLAVEWAGFARVNTVSPGYIDTTISKFVQKETKDVWRSMIPFRREALANELKGAYLYLASPASSYTTGSDLRVDGGYCLL